MKVLYNLPKKVLFCKKCVTSNQRPNSTVEYKHTKKSKRGNILQCKEDFDELFSKVINKNDYIMIKGSNATGLANISNKIINRATNAF